MIKQWMKREIRLIVLVLLGSFMPACASPYTSGHCSANWTVTGYYTPVESDYNDRKQQVRLASGEWAALDSRFLKDVMLEGWGKTREGWYLGYFGQQWHKRKEPKNALGRKLEIGMVAATKRLPFKSQIRLTGTASVLGVEKFTVLDRGGGVKHKHIDVYTGEGKKAKKLTWRVTGVSQLCVL